MMKVKFSQLRRIMISCVKARLPLLIVGGPGIAKTALTRSVAAELDADFLLSTPSTEDPTVPAGFPWASADKDEAFFKPFGNLARALKATKLTIWLLDDFGQALDPVQSAYMPLLQGNTPDGRKIPDCVVFVLCTNRRTDRAGMRGILEPVKSRCAVIVELVPDVDEWCAWAIQQPWMPPEMVAYHRFSSGKGRGEKFPEDVGMLYQFTPSADLINCPLPRTWERAARVYAQGDLPAFELQVALAGAVGEDAANDYLAFVRMFKELPSVDGILLDPDAAKIPQELSVLYSVATAIAAKTTDANFSRVARYAERMVDAGYGEFAALMIRDATRRRPSVQQTTAFVKLAAGELGRLIGGATD